MGQRLHDHKRARLRERERQTSARHMRVLNNDSIVRHCKDEGDVWVSGALVGGTVTKQSRGKGTRE